MFRILARLVAVLVVASLGYAPVARAAGEPPSDEGAAEARISRAATEAELRGLWQQVAVTATRAGIDLSAPWFSAPQYYLFLGDGRLKTAILEGAEAELTREQLAVWEQSPAAWSFELRSDGQTVLAHQDHGPMYHVKFEVFVADFDTSKLDPAVLAKNAHLIPRRGDVAMAYFGRDAEPAFFRVLRRYAPGR